MEGEVHPGFTWCDCPEAKVIPKIIHCFWTGGPKTKLAEKCLASWRKFAPDWEIREWGLSDFSDLPDFCKEAVRRELLGLTESNFV